MFVGAKTMWLDPILSVLFVVYWLQIEIAGKPKIVSRFQAP